MRAALSDALRATRILLDIPFVAISGACGWKCLSVEYFGTGLLFRATTGMVDGKVGLPEGSMDV